MKPAKRTRKPPVELGDLLTPPEVAKRLGVELATLVDWRYRGRGPAWIRVGGRLIRYPERPLTLVARVAPAGRRLDPCGSGSRAARQGSRDPPAHCRPPM